MLEHQGPESITLDVGRVLLAPAHLQVMLISCYRRIRMPIQECLAMGKSLYTPISTNPQQNKMASACSFFPSLDLIWLNGSVIG